MVMSSLLQDWPASGEDTTALWQQQEDDLKRQQELRANTGDVPYAQGPLPPTNGINPNQGGFRDPVTNPANVAPPAFPDLNPLPALGDIASNIANIPVPFYTTQAATPGGAPMGASPTIGQVYNADIPYYSDFARNTLQPAASDFGAMLGGALNAQFGGLPNFGANLFGTPSAQDVGSFAAEQSVPVSVGDVGLNILLGGGGPLEMVTGLPLDDAVRGLRGAAGDVFKAGLPEPSLFPGFGAGVPPGPMWNEAELGPLPLGPDVPGNMGALPRVDGPVINPEPRGLPSPPSLVDLNAPVRDLNVIEPQMHKISQLWAQGQPNAPLDSLPSTQQRTALYNAGLEANGTAEQIASRYALADAQGIKLPLDTPPSDLPDAFDLARRGATPQSPLNAPVDDTAQQMRDAMAKVREEERALTGGGSVPNPPSAETGVPTTPGSPPPASIGDIGRAKLAAEGLPTDVLSMEEAAVARQAEDAAKRNYIEGKGTQEVEQAIGRPLDTQESAAVSRRLEAPALATEGKDERAGIVPAPTRAQALEDAQQTFATRVQAQAERFRTGNGRDMTPQEYARMAESERVASGIQPEQVRAGILDWLNLPRSLMTGLDLSFALRQMLTLAPGHPIEWTKAVGSGIRSAFSEDYAAQVAQRIAGSPYRDVHKGLYLAPMEKGAGTIVQREEQYATALLDRIPIIGAIYRPFERGNVAMINQFRADVSDNFAKNTLALKGETLGAISPATQRQINVYDNFINRATGRGTFGDLDKSIAPLGQVFFSLRNTIAKPQAVASLASKPFTPAWNQMVRDMTGFLGLGATTLYLANSAGLKVGIDPKSADFGKIRVGDQHIDIWGGWQQQARAIFQAVQGARGEPNAVSGSGRESVKSPLEVALPWIGNRLSPQAGVAGQGLRSLVENKADDGPLRAALQQMFPDYRAPGLNSRTALNYLTPLWVQDVADGIKSEGLTGGLRTAPLTFFGVGVQTYPDVSNPRTAALNAGLTNPANLSGLPANVAAFLQDKSWNDATPKEQRAILAKMSPEERTAIEKAEQQLRENKDIFQLNRDEARGRSDLAASERAALKPLADKLLEQWKTGAVDPALAIEAMKRVEARADKEAQFTTNAGPKLSESSAYKEAVKGLAGNGASETDRIREITSKYFGVIDDPRVTRPDGSKDWDKIEAAQKAVLDSVRKSDPGFATRLEFNLQKDPGNDYELTRWVGKLDAQLDKAGYYAVPSSSKTEFTRQHPDVDALVSARYGNPVHSEAAARILHSLMPERKIEYAR